MAAPIDICNSALIKIGVTPIDSLSDTTSRAARLCNRQYPIIRDAFLTDTYWNCTMKRVVLSLSVDVPLFGFAFKYTLPINTLRVQHLNQKDFRFKVEFDRFLHTNLSSAKARIQFKNTDVSQYSPKMREALAYLLAVDLSFSFNQSARQVGLLEAKAEKELRKARSDDGQEGSMDELQQDVWLNARFTDVLGQTADDETA